MVKELSIKIAQDIINDNNPDSFLKELFNKPLSDNELYCVVSVTNNPAFRHLYSSFDYCTTMKEILEKSKLESTDLKSILLMMMINELSGRVESLPRSSTRHEPKFGPLYHLKIVD